MFRLIYSCEEGEDEAAGLEEPREEEEEEEVKLKDSQKSSTLDLRTPTKTGSHG